MVMDRVVEGYHLLEAVVSYMESKGVVEAHDGKSRRHLMLLSLPTIKRVNLITITFIT